MSARHERAEARKTYRSWCIYYMGDHGVRMRRRFPQDQRSNAREYAKELTERDGIRWIKVTPPVGFRDGDVVSYRWTRSTGWVSETQADVNAREAKA